jgi:hypothetical protein
VVSLYFSPNPYLFSSFPVALVQVFGGLIFGGGAHVLDYFIVSLLLFFFFIREHSLYSTLYFFSCDQ